MIGFYDYTVIATYISLGFAVIGITEAMSRHTGWATLCLVICGVLDMFDGKIARTKKNRTEEEKKFGIQLDSLCDIVCFGVLPAVIGFQLNLTAFWQRIILFLFVLAGLIRLAFFNVTEETRQKQTEEARKYYQGLPITMSSVIFPIVYLFKGAVPNDIFAYIYLGVMVITGCLFVLDFKVIKIQNVAIGLIAFVVLGIFMVFKLMRWF